MRTYNTLQLYTIMFGNTYYLPGPMILATSYEHAMLAIKHRGEKGLLQITTSAEIVHISPKIVEWDDLIIPNKLQLN